MTLGRPKTEKQQIHVARFCLERALLAHVYLVAISLQIESAKASMHGSRAVKSSQRYDRNLVKGCF